MEQEWRKFSADMASYQDMLDFALTEAKKGGVAPERMLRFQLGFEEAAVNVINYAYGGRKGAVWLRFNKAPGRFVLELADAGRPFNPLEQKGSQQVSDLAEASPGGWGISFLRTAFDEVAYHRGTQEEYWVNCLSLTIYIR